MRRIFVDTLYWSAITHRKDQWHQAAEKARRALVGCHLVTTEEVLTEVLDAFCEASRVLRQEAVDLVRDLHADPAVTIHPQSNQTFLSGLSLYLSVDHREIAFPERWVSECDPSGNSLDPTS